MRALLRVLLMVWAASARANDIYALAGEDAQPPPGWVDFCKRLPTECQSAADPAAHLLVPWRRPALTQNAWHGLDVINKAVNHNIEPMTDREHYGVEEYWAYPDDGKGDCEDYVLLKRAMLMDLGWPRSALLITVVSDRRGDTHAVLLVRTDQADFVLDNNTDAILLWSVTDFMRYKYRQSEYNPNRWVSIIQDPPPVGSLARRRGD